MLSILRGCGWGEHSAWTFLPPRLASPSGVAATHLLWTKFHSSSEWKPSSLAQQPLCASHHSKHWGKSERHGLPSGSLKSSEEGITLITPQRMKSLHLWCRLPKDTTGASESIMRHLSPSGGCREGCAESSGGARTWGFNVPILGQKIENITNRNKKRGDKPRPASLALFPHS